MEHYYEGYMIMCFKWLFAYVFHYGTVYGNERMQLYRYVVMYIH